MQAPGNIAVANRQARLKSGLPLLANYHTWQLRSLQFQGAAISVRCNPDPASSSLAAPLQETLEISRQDGQPSIAPAPPAPSEASGNPLQL